MNQKVRRMWVCAKMAVLTAFSALGLAQSANAQSGETKAEFTVCAFNVDGLPNKIAGIEINPDGKGADGATAIGEYLSGKAYDVVALSEDFNYHSNLVAPLEADYNIGTYRGGIQLDNYNANISFNTDGLEMLTRKPIVFGSETWTAWKTSYGKFDNGSDELISKGYRRYTVSLGHGLLVDFYILHMDAGDTENDIAARASQWQQLRDAILADNTGHPVVVMGDTNSRYTRDDISTLFIAPLSESYDVRDVWVEKCLGGEAPALGGASLMADSLGYEKGEIVDKVIYLNPKNSSVRLSATSINVDADSQLSDHKPLAVQFEATGKACAPAEANTWWRGEEWTGDGQEVYLYNVGQKYFISNDFSPCVSNIAQASLWHIYGDDSFTISNDTHRLQMKKQKSQQGVVEGSGATTFNNHEAGITEGSHRIGLKDWKTFLDQKTHFFAIAVENGSAIYTAATTKDENLDWLLISPAQKAAYERYNQLYQEVSGYLSNASLNLPSALEKQLSAALDSTAKSSYATCEADTTTLVEACGAVKAWLSRDVEVGASRYTTVCLPWNAAVPEGVSVYYATEYLSRAVPASVHLVKYEGNILPANTGFVLRADEGNNADTLHFAFSADSASLPEGNILHGTVNGIDNADLSFSDYTYMVLGSNSLGNGFRALGTQEQIPACSAWLQLPVDAEKPSATPDFAVFDFNYETTYLDIKIGDNRVASVCLPHNAEVPAGTTVYYATEYIAQVNPNAVHLQKYEGSVLPANTGLVVFANDDNDADTLRFAYTDADASQPEGNILSGTVSGMSGTDLSFSDFTYMTVGCTDLGNGFCALASGDSIPAYSAYLQLPLDAENPSAAPQFAVFDFNYETSLRGVSAPDANGASAWFSIGGMRQSGAQRGVNIVKKADGTVKKVLVK